MCYDGFVVYKALKIMTLTKDDVASKLLDDWNYVIYEDGSLYSLKYKRFLKPFAIGRGKDYLAYKLCHNCKEKTMQAHRLVALNFIPNPDNLATVNHKDGNKHNNHVSNLEWMTADDNLRHAYITGIRPPYCFRGSDHPMSKLNEEQVHEICQLLDQGHSVNEIYHMFENYKSDWIYRIMKRDNWKHISENYAWQTWQQNSPKKPPRNNK